MQSIKENTNILNFISKSAAALIADMSPDKKRKRNAETNSDTSTENNKPKRVKPNDRATRSSNSHSLSSNNTNENEETTVPVRKVTRDLNEKRNAKGNSDCDISIIIT